MIRVLYVTHYSKLYGANLSLLDLIDIIRSKEKLIPYVVMPSSGPLLQELRKRKIRYFVLPFRNWIHRNISGWEQAASLVIIAKKTIELLINRVLARILSHLLQNQRIDLVHTNTSVTNFGAVIALKLSVPHIWHMREYGKEDYNVEFDWGTANAYAFMAASSAKIIAISDDLKKKYLRYHNSSKIMTIYNGIKIRKLSSLKKKSSNYINLIMVGLLTPGKGHTVAIHALRILVDKGYKNIILNIVGDGRELRKLMNIVKKEELKRHVVFHGYIDQPYRLMANADIGLQCSTKEAFGRVLVEYMVSGIPVIASESGASREIISSTGLLFRTGDPEDLAKKIEMLLTNSKMMMKFRKVGRDRASNLFNIGLTGRKIFKLYKASLSKH
ncbi:MAG: glycosyltransferase family 4 protein [Candidatus Hodarchaeota archaeon]